MRDIREFVAAAAPLLMPGETIRNVCPVCCAEHEHSFSMRRDAHDTHRIWFRCWRVKCGVTGSYTDAKGLLLSVVAESAEGTKALPRLEPLPAVLAVRLSKQLQLPYGWGWANRVQYDPHANDVWYPWMNFGTTVKEQVGWQVRGADDKTFRFEYSGVLPGRTYTFARKPGSVSSQVVFVENVWSAYKVRELGYVGIALFGHSLSFGTAQHLRARLADREATNILVLLDADTWPTKITGVLRTLEAAGFTAHAKYTEDKPHTLSQGELAALIKS